MIPCKTPVCSFFKVTAVIGLLITMCGLIYVISDFEMPVGTASTSLRSSNADNDAYKIDLWFMAVKDHTPGHITYAKQAILSARDKTDLIPVIMLDGKDDDFEAWLKRHDTMVVHIEEHPVMKYFRDHNMMAAPNQGIATWERIVLPDVIDMMTNFHGNSTEDKHPHGDHDRAMGKPRLILNLPPRYQNRTIHTDYVLYTDADVMFQNHFSFRRQDLPRYVSMAVQGDAFCCSDNKYTKLMHSNAGVLVMNVTGYAEVYKEFIEFIKDHAHSIGLAALDQAALQRFFPQRIPNLSVWDRLVLYARHKKYYESLSSPYYSTRLPKIYEWEPYLGYNRQAVIVHWHGIKYYLDEHSCPGGGVMVTNSSSSSTSMNSSSSDSVSAIANTTISSNNSVGADLTVETEFDLLKIKRRPHDIQQFIREPPTNVVEVKKNYPWLMTLKPLAVAQEGFREYSELYTHYMRKVCHSNRRR